MLAVPGEFGVCEPASGGEAQHGREASEVGQLALVESEHALVQVSEQVERLDADVGAVKATLEQRPEVLGSVGVDLPIDVL